MTNRLDFMKLTIRYDGRFVGDELVAWKLQGLINKSSIKVIFCCFGE
ncbi:MAG: hypothetical protein IIY81_00510 [Lachnospiraceae bacterium]|nr:hypothetical protein [Lachnospiraceae bacterium]